MTETFFHGWLAAYALCLGAPVGCAVLLMMHCLTGGRWGWSIRPIIEGGAATVWLAGALFLPVLAGLHDLYPWTHEAEVAASEALQHKTNYLNVPFYVARSVVVLGLWSVGALMLVRRSRRSRLKDAAEPGALSAAGILLYVLSVTIASVDWFASLQPTWYSTAWGLYVGMGHVLTGLALAVLLRLHAPGEPPDRATLRDLGNLLLAFVVLHAYLAYSQLFIHWIGDKPHEIEWWLPRWDGVWAGLGVTLVIVHMALPIVLLLFRDIKHRPRVLSAVAGLILVARAVDASWIVLPASKASPWVLIVVAAGLMTVTGAAVWWLVMRSWRRLEA